MTLEKMLSELQFEPVIEEAVNKKITKDRRLIKEIAETAYSSDDFNFPLCKRMPFTRLVVVTYLLTLKYEEYKVIGVSDDIILDTFRDVSLRANLYYKKSGKIGLAKDDVIWFRHIMNVCIFKIGALQYQNFEMLYLDESTIGEAYMTFSEDQKSKLPNGSPVINCHVQRNADISAASVEKSLELAKVFFSEHFPTIRYKAFLCYSWLLYPSMLRSLPNGSNIKQFAEHFSIISSCKDSAQAMENLFDNGKPNMAHELTSLQRMVMDHTVTLGFGCGIIMI